MLCCLPGIITVVIVRSPTQIRDGVGGERTPASPTDPHRIAPHRCCWRCSPCLFQTCLYLIRYPPLRPPARLPHRRSLTTPFSSHRRPHSKGRQPSKTKRLSLPLPPVRTDVSVTCDTDRHPHHCIVIQPSRAPLVVQRLARLSIILNSYFHNQGQSPDHSLRVRLTGTPSAIQRPNHATQSPPR